MQYGGGTWIHYKLGVPLAQWLSPDFALTVSDWVEEWITTGLNPISLQEIQQIQTRMQLKDEDRLYLTDQIKIYLEDIGSYFSESSETKRVFWEIHDAINKIITGETAQEMRDRTGLEPNQLLRDYFPLHALSRYSALTIATANYIRDGVEPGVAVLKAAKQALPCNYVPIPVELVEPVGNLKKKLLESMLYSGELKRLPPMKRDGVFPLIPIIRGPFDDSN